MTHDLLFQAMDVSQAASTAMALFFSALVGTALFFTQMASAAEITKEEEGFAKSEIRRYESVQRTVLERARMERDPRRLARLEKDLRKLTNNLDETKEALERLKTAEGNDRTFAREDLRGSLFSLQDSGTKAVDAVMKADLMAPVSVPKDGPTSAVLPVSFMPSASGALGSDPIP